MTSATEKMLNTHDTLKIVTLPLSFENLKRVE